MCHQSPRIGREQPYGPVIEFLCRTNPLGPEGFGSINRATPPVSESTAEAANWNGPALLGKDTACPAATWSASRSRADLAVRNFMRNGQRVQALTPGINDRIMTHFQTDELQECDP